MSNVLVVCYKLPLPLNDQGSLQLCDEQGLENSVTGLMGALRAALRPQDCRWAGWPGIATESDSEREELNAQLAQAGGDMLPIHFSADEVSSYLTGFCNSCLWPLFHYFLSDVQHNSAWFEGYRKVNQRFAEAVAFAAEPGQRVWIHDYHLLLLPALLRQLRPDLKIGFFLHTPFPSYEVFRCLPNRAELLQGLLGADLIGFHTFGYLRHFRSALLRIAGIESEIDYIPHTTHTTGIGVFPMGIDWMGMERLLASAELEEETSKFAKAYDGKKVVLSVERLDYTKGVPRKLQGIEVFLDRNPALRDKVCFVIIAMPSRETVGRYQELIQEVQLTVGRINGKYSSPGNVPIHFIHRSIPSAQIYALYKRAEVGLVTPLIDGMNLVAKEYVACQTDGDGVLILSEFAGAAQELPDAHMVNPYNMEEIAQAIADALPGNPPERREQVQAMRQQVIERDARFWAQQFLDGLEKERPIVLTATGGRIDDAVIGRLKDGGGKKKVFLDYDGTLTEIVLDPKDAVPSEELLAALSVLSKRGDYEIYVVSGRAPAFLEQHLGHLPLHLVAEHGFTVRETGQEWRLFNPEVDLRWKETLLPIMSLYARSTPGAYVEEKVSSLVFHFRGADPEFGRWKASELLGELRGVIENLPVEIRQGKAIVEVRSQQVSKGAVVRSVLQSAPYDLALAIGDDQTDESMFTQRLPNFYTVKVGPGDTAAMYHLDSPQTVRRFLTNLAA